MFSKSTVFVIGAGVSSPFGLPVGKQLKDAICDSNVIPTSTIENILRRGLGQQSGDAAKHFINAYRASGMYSIDTWLEANKADAELLKVGKFAIAAIIMHYEKEASGKGAPVDLDWYGWLWNNIWTPNIEDISDNNISIVSFNYDRLLEWKLDQQIKNTYLRATPDQHATAFAFLRSRIVHVHGQLGLSGTDDYSHSFGKDTLSGINNGFAAEANNKLDLYAARMVTYSEPINIVCETVADQAQVERAKAMVQQSDARLIFLGFSFDKRNVLKFDLDMHTRLIGQTILSDSENELATSRYIGTAMGIKRGERESVREMFNGKIALGPDHMDAVAFCRSYVRTS